MNDVLVNVNGLHKDFPLHPVSFGAREKQTAPGRTLRVLRGLDFELSKGQMISIVGPSGAGKSTFLHILGALDRPTKGTVNFEGKDVFSRSDKELALFRNRCVGFIFQFHQLLPDFTALENASIPLLLGGYSRSKAQNQANELLVKMGMEDRLGHKPGELSGGEQQRVAIARALVTKPKLVLADEPTGNLDSETGEEIFGLLVGLNRDTGVSMIVVTHNEALAARIPIRYRLEDGRLFLDDRNS